MYANTQSPKLFPTLDLPKNHVHPLNQFLFSTSTYNINPFNKLYSYLNSSFSPLNTSLNASLKSNSIDDCHHIDPIAQFQSQSNNPITDTTTPITTTATHTTKQNLNQLIKMNKNKSTRTSSSTSNSIITSLKHSIYFTELDELDFWFQSLNSPSLNSDYNLDYEDLRISTELLSSYNRSYSTTSSTTNPRTKLLICHDFNNGYLLNQDDSPQGYFPHPTGERYFIQYPQLIDTFIYFSHHRISIPPVNWINTCHKNGIKCLGTIIFEGNNSLDFNKLDELIKKNSFGKFKYVEMLCKLVQFYGFDGFLLNIETKFSNSKLSSQLLPFIDQLKAELHSLDMKNQLIWYDSYIYPQNKIYYINGVSNLNFNFYNQLDSIFTNYWWNINNLQENIKNVGIIGSQEKIFVGYDVWGRGSLVGKGGFDSSLACSMIKKYLSNVALFAPAWTYEYLGSTNFIENDTRFWIGLHESEFSISSSIESYNSSIFKINDSSFSF